MQKLTLQEMFDKIWSVAATGEMTVQNRDETNNNVLSYEHLPFGCFIGLCLPKDLAKRTQVESIKRCAYDVSNFYSQHHWKVKAFQEVREVLPDDCVKAMSELQGIHDGRDPNYWKDSLVMFAGLYNLTVPTVEEPQNV